MSTVSFSKFLRGDCAALENKVRRWYILRGAGYVDSRFILRSRPLDLIIGQGCHNWVDLDPLRGVARRWYFMSGDGFLCSVPVVYMCGPVCLHLNWILQNWVSHDNEGSGAALRGDGIFCPATVKNARRWSFRNAY